ncbi:hypothetical protein EVAR_33531_1 [Eumeta japonica]|uniref:Uncharacterized protein n=1 Tax=Eumeta variegata TaxID=151549 RepID=A0A4C1VK51_EUMVA|nr:hypothetical protein EVAR_33531_1 [Eumeta japonica]
MKWKATERSRVESADARLGRKLPALTHLRLRMRRPARALAQNSMSTGGKAIVLSDSFEVSSSDCMHARDASWSPMGCTVSPTGLNFLKLSERAPAYVPLFSYCPSSFSYTGVIVSKSCTLMYGYIGLKYVGDLWLGRATVTRMKDERVGPRTTGEGDRNLLAAAKRLVIR